MKQAAAAVLALALVAGCDLVPPTKGNGTVKTDTRAMTDFKQVVNATAYKMTVAEGSTSGIAVTVDENLQSLVTANVVNGALVVSTVGNPAPSAEPLLAVTLPELQGATLAGSGSVEVGNLSQARALALVNTGSGPLHFSGQALAMVAKVSGAGPMVLSGTANGLDADVSGSGALEAKDLTVNGAAQLASSGSGNITATVNGNISFTLSGSGNIDWFGTANVSGQNVTGSGKVTHH